MERRSALAEFIHALVCEQQALHDAAWADSESLKYAEAVYNRRQKPLTPEEIAEDEQSVRQRIESDLLKIGKSPEKAKQFAADYPYRPFDPEDYLRPRLYELNGEQIETPPQITEDDVNRYASRNGVPFDATWNDDRTAATWFDYGRSRTDKLLADFQAAGANGFSRPHLLHREAIAEATAAGLAAALAPLLIEALDAHEAYLSAARIAEQHGKRQVDPGVWERHGMAIGKLMPYLPPDEREESAERTEDQPPTERTFPAHLLTKLSSKQNQLIEHLWKAKGRTASFTDLIDASISTEGGLKKLIERTGEKLLKLGETIVFETGNEHVTLVLTKRTN